LKARGGGGKKEQGDRTRMFVGRNIALNRSEKKKDRRYGNASERHTYKRRGVKIFQPNRHEERGKGVHIVCGSGAQ